ncbi:MULTISPECIES: hypothetical protein [unclassified Variovorax]|jgi:hypothetical protein|uniref:hypothetical protein n=1 Tax=unclassified Variovorax TaxID=663243 RepID=UPI0008CEC0F3|nr:MULTISPECIES: hypothetical protein [unclassified Variovorax]SEK07232.1 hypothetical protein SAMN05518853_107288 [Variovorax sp. OK202]SFD49686.1 hypothetical protein SAMN05444746_107288 [Variovorax sp. OK212]
MAKPTRTAAQLRSLLLERIETIPDLRGVPTDVHDAGVVWADPGGEGGANWTVPVRTDRGAHRVDIARIVRELQMRFDLED